MRLVLAALILVIAGTCGLLWAGHSTATSTCTADPPGIQVPDGSRSVDLRVAGWDCVVTKNGTEVARVDLGWRPTDARTAWAATELR